MDGPPLFSLASQASHAAAAGRPPETPQRTASSLIDSGLGGVGGDVVFSAGTRRVPFTPTRSAWKKLRVSHDSESPNVRHPDLLTSTSSSSTMPLESLSSSSWNLKPHQIFQMPHAPRSSQVREWEVAPARVGGPGRKVYARGSKRDVCAFESSEDGVRGAIQVYEREKFSSSSKASHLSHLKWWIERCKVRRCAPYPLTVPKLQYVAALLKNSKYRSAGQYLSAFKRQHIKLGHVWDDAINLEFTDAMRSCKRGLGPSKQTGYFDVDSLFAWGQKKSRDRFWPQVKGGPSLPREATEVACHWALREIEISSARVGAVSFQLGPGCGIASFDLPVSKSDVHALGKVRSHGCACPAACPVLALRKLVEFAGGGSGSGSASVGFPSVGGVRPNVSFFKEAVASRPLCPTPAGGFPTKAGMTSVFQRLGLELGVSKHITGHMPRVSGAVHLAKAGLEIWKIQIFCRWGSDVVLRYIQDAPLEQSHKWARDAAVGLGLTEARNELVSQFRATNPDKVLSLPEGSLELASARALNDLHESMEVQLQRKDDRWSSVLSILEGKLEAVASRVGMETPKYVLNNSGKGKIHLVRNAFTTVCGWEWHDHRHAVRRQVLAEGDNVCTRCGAMSQG